jgi:deoxyribonuclease V
MTALTVPATVEEAYAIQDRLRPFVDLADPGPSAPRAIAGLDVAYAESGDRLAAAVVVLEAATLAVVDEAIVVDRPAFPYVPGLFAFRELPALLKALDRLTMAPDLLLCDGHGLAHPRRFGLACHLGVLTGLPSIGVAKTPLIGHWKDPAPHRGATADLHAALPDDRLIKGSPARHADVGAGDPLINREDRGDREDSGGREDRGELVGRVVRTQDRVRPVFVSVGHRMSLDNACARVLAATTRYRLPETTRQADQRCRAALRGATPPAAG